MADNNALQDPSTQQTTMDWSDEFKNDMNTVVNTILTQYTQSPEDQWSNTVKVLHPWWLAKLCIDKEGTPPSPKTDIEQKLMVRLPTFCLRYDYSMYILHAKLSIINTIKYLKSLNIRANVSHVEWEIDNSTTPPTAQPVNWPEEEYTEYIFHIYIKIDDNISHANVAYLIKDRTSKQYIMYYYEPHGNVKLDTMKITFLAEVKKKLPDLNTHVIAIGIDIGNMQRTFANITEIAEPGFCLYFCTHWLMQVMVLLNVLKDTADVKHAFIENIEKYNLSTCLATELYNRIVSIVHNVVRFTRKQELNKDDEDTNYYNHSVPDRFKQYLVREDDVVPLNIFYCKMLYLYRIDADNLTKFLIGNTIRAEEVDVKDDKIYNQPPFSCLKNDEVDLYMGKIKTDTTTLQYVGEQYYLEIEEIEEMEEMKKERKEEKYRLKEKKRKMPLKFEADTMTKRNRKQARIEILEQKYPDSIETLKRQLPLRQQIERWRQYNDIQSNLSEALELDRNLELNFVALNLNNLI